MHAAGSNIVKYNEQRSVEYIPWTRGEAKLGLDQAWRNGDSEPQVGVSPLEWPFGLS